MRIDFDTWVEKIKNKTDSTIFNKANPDIMKFIYDMGSVTKDDNDDNFSNVVEHAIAMFAMTYDYGIANMIKDTFGGSIYYNLTGFYIIYVDINGIAYDINIADDKEVIMSLNLYKKSNMNVFPIEFLSRDLLDYHKRNPFIHEIYSDNTKYQELLSDALYRVTVYTTNAHDRVKNSKFYNIFYKSTDENKIIRHEIFLGGIESAREALMMAIDLKDFFNLDEKDIDNIYLIKEFIIRPDYTVQTIDHDIDEIELMLK